MKKIKILFNSIAIGVLSTGGVAGAVLGTIFITNAESNAANQRKKNHSTNLNISSSKDISSGKTSVMFPLGKKINLLSLGDSIASGFTAQDQNGHRGSGSASTKITGISYGSYMARALKHANLLQNFDNYAVGSLTTEGILNLMLPNFELKDSALKQFNIATSGNLVIKEYKEWIKKQPNKKLSIIQEKIQKADLITLTMGGNDLLDAFEFFGLSVKEFEALIDGDNSNNSKLNVSQLFEVNLEKITKSILRIEYMFNVIYNVINILNSNVKIIIVGYPAPFLQIKAFSDLLTFDETLDTSKLEVLLEQLSFVGRRIANNKENVDFIDIDYKNIWVKHNRSFGTVLYDIHPTALGYRFMAGIILDKLSHSIDRIILEHNKNYNYEKTDLDVDKDHDPQPGTINDQTPRTFKQRFISNSKLDEAIEDLYWFQYLDATNLKIKFVPKTVKKTEADIVAFGEMALDHLEHKLHWLYNNERNEEIVDELEKTINKKPGFLNTKELLKHKFISIQSDEHLLSAILLQNIISNTKKTVLRTTNFVKLHKLKIDKMSIKVTLTNKEEMLNNLISVLRLHKKFVKPYSIKNTISKLSKNKDFDIKSIQSPVFKLFYSVVATENSGTIRNLGFFLQPILTKIFNNLADTKLPVVKWKHLFNPLQFLTETLEISSDIKNFVFNFLDSIDKELADEKNKQIIEIGLDYLFATIIKFTPHILNAAKESKFAIRIDKEETQSIQNIYDVMNILGVTIISKLLEDVEKELKPKYKFLSKYFEDKKHIIGKFTSKLKTMFDNQTDLLFTEAINNFVKDQSNFLSIYDNNKKGRPKYDLNGYKEVEFE